MICVMSAAYAQRIAGWIYPGAYAIYSFPGDDEAIRELMDASYFVRLDKTGELTGYYCFGSSARIPTVEEGVYDAHLLDIGLGMRPDLCGQGGGTAFVMEGLRFGRAKFGALGFRLTVAAFNLRAIRTYEKAGFAVEKKIVHGESGMDFFVMMRKDAVWTAR